LEGRATSHDGPADVVEVEPLLRIVERQRRENQNLRIAMRSRAIVEQAKGILVARTGSDPETAFNELVAHSQRTNRKLIQLAAELVAATISAPHRQEGVEDRRQVLQEASTWDPSTLRTVAAVVAAPDLDELLQVVVQHTRRFGATAGLLALAEPDGALRIVGACGYEPHAVSGWQRIPPGDELPMTWAADHRSGVWLRDRAERERTFGGARRFPGHREACVALPLEAEEQLVGVLCLDWEEPATFDEDARRTVSSVAELCAEPVARLLHGVEEGLPGVDVEPGWAEWFWGFLDAQPTAHLVLAPHLDADTLLDVEVLYANRLAHELTGLLAGQRMLEHFPILADSELFRVVAEVASSGEAGVLAVDREAAGRQVLDPSGPVSVTRVGTAVVLSWLPDV
jgi:hypothetical protein